MLKIKSIIVVISVSLFLLSGYSFAFDDDDFQYWNTESVSWEINKHCCCMDRIGPPRR